MNLQVQLFAAARDAAGQSSVEVRLSAGGSVGDLREQLLQNFPNMNSMAMLLFVAVNNEYAEDDQVLNEKDTIACFPPVSGG